MSLKIATGVVAVVVTTVAGVLFYDQDPWTLLGVILELRDSQP